MIYRPLKNKTSSNVFRLSLFLGVILLVFLLSKINTVKNITTKSAAFFYKNRYDFLASREKTELIEKINDLEKNQMMGDGASVILGGGYIFSDTLLINRGSNFGVQINDLAIADSSIIIGRVSEVGNDWSKITPFSALNQKTTARAGENKSILFSEITGAGAGEMKTEIAQNDAIKTGDTVWWGENQNYIIGIIDKISESGGASLEEITIETPIPLNLTAKINLIKP